MTLTWLRTASDFHRLIFSVDLSSVRQPAVAPRDAKMNSSCAIDMVMISMLHFRHSMSFPLSSRHHTPSVEIRTFGKLLILFRFSCNNEFNGLLIALNSAHRLVCVVGGLVRFTRYMVFGLINTVVTPTHSHIRLRFDSLIVIKDF